MLSNENKTSNLRYSKEGTFFMEGKVLLHSSVYLNVIGRDFSNNQPLSTSLDKLAKTLLTKIIYLS